MNKVKLDVLKPWITKKIAEFLKMDDDVVVEFVFNQLEEKVRP
jgi:serine/arginine repetitive matrix protein 1